MEREVQEVIGPWLSETLRPDLFITGTYDRRKFCRACRQGRASDGCSHGAAVSTWKAQRDGRWLFIEASRALRRPVDGALFIEGHQLDNSAHLHGLLALGGGLQQGDIAAVSRVWRRHGFSRIEVPRSPADVCGYCGKYVTKALGEVVFSNGLDRDLKLVGRFGR